METLEDLLFEEYKTEIPKHLYDVIIIGAGFSGLSAGLFLYESNIKNFVILEARDRVGGRVCTEQVKLKNNKITNVDAGGAYVGCTQNRLLKMAKKYKNPTYKVNVKEKTVLNLNNIISKYTGTIPTNLSIFSLLDLNNILQKIDKLANDIDTNDWTNVNSVGKKKAEYYDSINIKQFVDEHCWTKDAKELVSIAIRGVLCKECDEVSLLYFLNYVKSGDGIFRLTEVENGAQERKFKYGSHSICQNIFNDLNKDNQQRVLLSHIVTNIEQIPDFVNVRCKNGNIYSSRYVIVALQPTLYKTIEWKPKLNEKRRELGEQLKMGSIIKTCTYYEEAFWKQLNMCGTTISNDAENDPVVVSYDDTKPDGSFPGIMGFIVADSVSKFTKLTYEERKQCVAKQYARLFKDDRALNPLYYHEKNWSEEEFSGGCYVNVANINIMTKYGDILRQPEGQRIYFAGTELATQWMGYMDGAIQSGERAAYQVGKLLTQYLDDGENIKLKNFEEIEPEPQNCEIPYVTIGPKWYEKLLPNNFQLIVIIIAIIVSIIAFLLK